MFWKRICIQSLFLATSLWAQPSHPNCAPLANTDFQFTELVNKGGTAGAKDDGTLSEPTRMDIQVVKDDTGGYSHTNIFYVQRTGLVKYYDGAAKSVKTMGTIPTWGIQDNGLMGVAIDPNYAANRRIYLWYAPNKTKSGANMTEQTPRRLVLSRFVVKPDNTLDMTSEKILIDITGSKTDRWHSGGPMQFDKHGDLWIAIGNNSHDLTVSSCSVMHATNQDSSAEWSASNTASMFGGFIRIHPDDSQKGYSIPGGNFGQYWADQFDKQGRTALAEEYRNPAKVLPEIYVKGERSNYSIFVHPTKRWLAWGTVNYSNTFDEFNITRTPIFSGFPYFHKNNLKTCPSHNVSVEAPTNNSPFNTGVRDLPPAVGATFNSPVNVAIGGPIYSFDSSLKSNDKFPPHFDNTWIMAGFGNSGSTDAIYVAKLDTANLTVAGTPYKMNPSVFLTPRNFIQAMYGEDGALYVLQYSGTAYSQPVNPGILRISYKGTCKVPFTVSTAPRPAAYQSIWISGMALVVAEKGDHEFSFHALNGRLLHRESGHGRKEYRLPDIQRRLGLPRGAYLVRVKTGTGAFSRNVSLL